MIISRRCEVCFARKRTHHSTGTTRQSLLDPTLRDETHAVDEVLGLFILHIFENLHMTGRLGTSTRSLATFQYFTRRINNSRHRVIAWRTIQEDGITFFPSESPAIHCISMRNRRGVVCTTPVHKLCLLTCLREQSMRLPTDIRAPAGPSALPLRSSSCSIVMRCKAAPRRAAPGGRRPVRASWRDLIRGHRATSAATSREARPSPSGQSCAPTPPETDDE